MVALKVLFGMKILFGKPQDAQGLRKACIWQVTPCNRHGWRPSFCATRLSWSADPQEGGQAHPFNLLTVNHDCLAGPFRRGVVADPPPAPAHRTGHEASVVAAGTRDC